MRRIEVLICDDSAVVRGLLVRALESDPEVHIAGTAMHGEAALKLLKREQVDVVVMDVEMPVMDGLTALPRILCEHPHVRVIMASALTIEGAATTVHALALGAAECIAKPAGNSVAESIRLLSEELLPLVKALGKRASAHDGGHRATAADTARNPADDASRPAAQPASASRSLGTAQREWSLSPKPRFPVNPEIVVIGTSTGGPNALSVLVAGLSTMIEQPILIVQHMPPLFTPMLAKHLAKDSGRPCSEGEHNGPVLPGHMYVAPGDYHMELVRRNGELLTVLNQNPPEHFCRPSVNPLFRTAVELFGNRVLAVMLTGMGDDGIEATREISARGGYVIAQDEASSVVWGMPGAVIRAGLAHEVLPLEDIASAIGRICCRKEHALR